MKQIQKLQRSFSTVENLLDFFSRNEFPGETVSATISHDPSLIARQKGSWMDYCYRVVHIHRAHIL